MEIPNVGIIEVGDLSRRHDDVFKKEKIYIYKKNLPYISVNPII